MISQKPNNMHLQHNEDIIFATSQIDMEMAARCCISQCVKGIAVVLMKKRSGVFNSYKYIHIISSHNTSHTFISHMERQQLHDQLWSESHSSELTAPESNKHDRCANSDLHSAANLLGYYPECLSNTARKQTNRQPICLDLLFMNMNTRWGGCWKCILCIYFTDRVHCLTCANTHCDTGDSLWGYYGSWKTNTPYTTTLICCFPFINSFTRHVL